VDSLVNFNIGNWGKRVTKVFISYSHKQGEWVWDRLVPCLKAGGTELLIDRERFEVGKTVIGQMDATQDKADKHIVVLSRDYLDSRYCRHEMNRAIKCDPKFEQGIVVPVLRESCKLPTSIPKWNAPLYADLRDDKQSDPWSLLLQQCKATQLGVTVPTWLNARDEIVRCMQRGQSVNLVVRGEVNWETLVEHIAHDSLEDLAVVNLEDPDTISRRGLLMTISQALGERVPLPDKPRDLAEFKKRLQTRGISRVALVRFDLAPYRPAEYDVDLFAALRYFIMDTRKLVILVQSRTPFSALLPSDHPLSSITLHTVELAGPS
jgi:TIR domain